MYSGFSKNHAYYNRVRANTQREKWFFMLRAMIRCHHVLSVMPFLLTGIQENVYPSWKAVWNAGWWYADFAVVPDLRYIQNCLTPYKHYQTEILSEVIDGIVTQDDLECFNHQRLSLEELYEKYRSVFVKSVLLYNFLFFLWYNPFIERHCDENRCWGAT